MEKTLNILKTIWVDSDRAAVEGSEQYPDSVLTGVIKNIEWHLPEDVYTSGKVYFKITMEDVKVYKKSSYPHGTNDNSIQSLTDIFELNNFAIKRADKL